MVYCGSKITSKKEMVEVNYKKKMDGIASTAERQYLISLKDIRNFWMGQKLKENS